MTVSSQAMMRNTDWALLLLLGVIWGASFFFARIAVAEVEPLVLVFLRVAIAALALQLYLALRAVSIRSALPRAGEFLLLALLNNIVPFFLIFLGQTELGAGLAAVLNATTPFWTLLIAGAATRDERLSPNKLIGILVGVLGTAIVVGPGLWDAAGSPLWAKLALIGASVSYGCAAVYAKRFRGMEPPLIAVSQLSLSALIVLPFAWAINGFDAAFAASGAAWAAIVAIALLSTAFAYILFFRLLASAGATNASLVTQVVPVTAVLLGTLFLGERIAWAELLGMGVIAIGFAIVDGRVVSRSFWRAAPVRS